jgi:hypothetical protein
MNHWSVPEMWCGDCWIIGGGRSVLQEFGVPQDIISKVESGGLPYSTYSEYLSPLHSKNVVGTNIAFKLGSWVSALYFCDRQFFRDHREGILSFPNLKVTCVNHIDTELQPFTTNLKRLKRDYQAGLSTRKDTICWNGNSGAAAINFAVHAGAKRILLLGFDMVLQDSRSHWHRVYKKNTHKNDFIRFIQKFPAIAKDAKSRGIEILNVSPISAIDCFPKVSLKDVL